MDDLDVLRRFLNLAINSSEVVFEIFSASPNAIHRGYGLEQFVFIQGTRRNRVLIVAHADTVWDDLYRVNKTSVVCSNNRKYAIIQTPAHQSNVDQVLIEENNYGFEGVKMFRKNMGLGADDRAGCAMAWLLKELGHSILITGGEEGGRIGSKWLMDKNSDIADAINDDHQFVVQLDRKGGRDYKCYGVGTDEFRAYVEEMTNYTEPDYDSYTDIVTLCRKITGVNLSVGYDNEHTKKEYIDVNQWKWTLEVCRKWLSQRHLPRFNLNVQARRH